uniref:Putative secreted protein n=1 Tax=Anopheles darlingi TaxID=43151 RepID=A0A2M4D464_ANODA
MKFSCAGLLPILFVVFIEAHRDGFRSLCKQRSQAISFNTTPCKPENSLHVLCASNDCILGSGSSNQHHNLPLQRVHSTLSHLAPSHLMR